MQENTINKQYSRNAGIDLLRVIAIFLICFSHSVTIRSMVEMPTYSFSNMFSLLADPCGDIGNCLFVICSAYFLVDKTKTRTEKAINLLLDSCIISILFLVGFLISGSLNDIGWKIIIMQFVPDIFAVNWFIPCYVIFYLLAPIVVVGLKALSSRGHFVVVVVSILTYGLLSVVNLAPIGSKLLQFFFILNIVAFIKWHRPSILEKTKLNILVFIVGFVVLFGIFYCTFILSNRFAFLNKIQLTTLFSPFIVIPCISLFIVFRNMNFECKLISYISELSLFVYLIHDNYFLRTITRVQYYNYMLDNFNSSYIILWMISCTLVMFLGGILLSIVYKESIAKFTKKLSGKINSVFAKVFSKFDENNFDQVDN